MGDRGLADFELVDLARVEMVEGDESFASFKKPTAGEWNLIQAILMKK